jgi:hypothetical protein
MVGDTLRAVVGFVTDGSTLVSGVVVELWQGDLQTDTSTTDGHGFYYSPKVNPGSYKVKCESVVKPITIACGEIATVNFP